MAFQGQGTLVLAECWSKAEVYYQIQLLEPLLSSHYCKKRFIFNYWKRI